MGRRVVEGEGWARRTAVDGEAGPEPSPKQALASAAVGAVRARRGTQGGRGGRAPGMRKAGRGRRAGARRRRGTGTSELTQRGGAGKKSEKWFYEKYSCRRVFGA